MGRDRLCGSCGEKALNRQVYIFRYLIFMERKHLHEGPCSVGYGTSTVVRKLHRWLSMSGISTSLEVGSVKPSRNPQADGFGV
jgi:hypothetical protein